MTVTTSDTRVTSAIHHWAARFVTQGVVLSDFETGFTSEHPMIHYVDVPPLSPDLVCDIDSTVDDRILVKTLQALSDDMAARAGTIEFQHSAVLCGGSGLADEDQTPAGWSGVTAHETLPAQSG